MKKKLVFVLCVLGLVIILEYALFTVATNIVEAPSCPVSYSFDAAYNSDNDTYYFSAPHYSNSIYSYSEANGMDRVVFSLNDKYSFTLSGDCLYYCDSKPLGRTSRLICLNLRTGARHEILQDMLVYSICGSNETHLFLKCFEPEPTTYVVGMVTYEFESQKVTWLSEVEYAGSYECDKGITLVDPQQKSHYLDYETNSIQAVPDTGDGIEVLHSERVVEAIATATDMHSVYVDGKMVVDSKPVYRLAAGDQYVAWFSSLEEPYMLSVLDITNGADQCRITEYELKAVSDIYIYGDQLYVLNDSRPLSILQLNLTNGARKLIRP